ncbi:MAG: CHAT domain-containing tetratricopeptide repeat protein [Pseudomonadota bacterium]
MGTQGEVVCGLPLRRAWQAIVIGLGLAAPTTGAFAASDFAVGSRLVITDEAPHEITLPAGRWLLGKSARFCEAELEITGLAALPTVVARADGHLLLIPIETSAALTLTLKATISNQRARECDIHVETFTTDGLSAELLEREAALTDSYARSGDAEREVRIPLAIDLGKAWARSSSNQQIGASRWLIAASNSGRLGRHREVVELTRRGLDCCGSLSDAWLKGQLLNSMGLALARTRQSELARSALEKASSTLAPEYENKAANVAQSNLCFLKFRVLKEFEAAETCYARLLETAQTLGDGTGEVRYLNLLGGTLSQRGQPRKALEYIDLAYNHPRAKQRDRLQADIARARALELSRLGRFQEALELLQESLTISQEIDDRMGAGRTLNNMGIAYGRLGVYRQAAELLEQSYALASTANADRQLSVGIGYANALIYLGEVDRLAALLAELESLATISEDAALVRQLRLLSASEAEARGNAAEALVALEVLIDEFSHDPPSESRYLISALNVASQAALAQGDAESALAFATQSVQRSEQTDNLMKIAASIAMRARALQMLGESDSAIADAYAAIELIERLRGDLQQIETRASYQSTKLGAYALLIDLLSESGEIEQSLEVAERYRAQTLVDVLQKGNANPPTTAPVNLVTTRADLRAEINRREQARLSGKTTESISDLLAELNVLDAKISEFDPRYRATQRNFALPAAELRETLDEGTVALQYMLGTERSYAWLMDRDAIELVYLPANSEIESLARELHATLSRRGDAQDLLVTTGRLLLGPFAEKLARAKRVAIVPDGALHYVPFDALMLSPDTPPVLATVPISHQASLTALTLTRGYARTKGNTIVAIADPIFSVSDARLDSPPAGSTAEQNPLNRLRLSALEAATLEQLAPDRTRVFMGFDANVTLLAPDALSEVSILHLATHGFADDETPARTGVMLSLFDEEGNPQAGFLGLRDIYELRLDSELVTLSACETALGQQLAGEGLLGLTRGFMYAGARRVVASLWPVSDRATAELMQHFYQAMLEDGLAPDAALAQAKRELSRNRRFRHPYYWASFVLHGDWRPLGGRGEIIDTPVTAGR